MKFTLDYLLTNTMIYWTTGSIISTTRFYKETLKTNIENRLDNEFRNIYSYFHQGSHFAALEEARLLADDLLQFVRKVKLF
ncbi:epoxide hydrolase 1-like [Oncorhynchus kisutch]|uniref:epoxide hydrolase 1-like n=1 Tax=Oncorhynchus kisutch TaxID=8019 RepID=UPI0012DC47FD|nr:epoxide hydrolase 1-like [Oncorhynchus kisutch]